MSDRYTYPEDFDIEEDYSKIDIEFNPLHNYMRGRTAHGNMYFDVPFMSLIHSQIDEDGQETNELWMGGCTDGLVLPKFIKNVISLYPWEQYTVNHALNSNLTVLMYDSSDPDQVSVEKITRIAHWVNEVLEEGPTLVHCQAGLNRSGMIVASSLVLRGWTAKEAIELLREQRSSACLCNPFFENMVYRVDEAQL